MTVFVHLKITAANKDGIVYCLGSPDNSVTHEKVYKRSFKPFIKLQAPWLILLPRQSQ